MYKKNKKGQMTKWVIGLIIGLAILVIGYYMISAYILEPGNNLGETTNCENLPLGKNGECMTKSQCENNDGKIIPGTGYCEGEEVCCVEEFFS